MVVDPFGQVCPPIWGCPFRSLPPRVLTVISSAAERRTDVSQDDMLDEAPGHLLFIFAKARASQPTAGRITSQNSDGRLEISSQGMSHSRSQITEPNHRQWNLRDHPEHFGPNTGPQVPLGVPDVYGRRSRGITMMLAHERKQRDNSTVHFPGGIRASEVQRPTPGRVSSESNHVDMHRDRVVEGILSGGPSLADSFPIARIDNGPNAAINLRSNPPFQLVTQCSLLETF